MPLNITNIKTSSNGAWQGDNPMNYAFPLLIAQITLVLFMSRFLTFLLKPLRQPRVVAEIVAGILLGPSALGRNKDVLHLVFPSWSTPILESVASIGLLFFLFLVGLELDLSSIRQGSRRAFGIALAGISLPFVFGVGLSFFLRKAVHGEEKVGYGQYLMFMGVALSITAFPVLARILAELKLLTTHVGQTAMAAAAFNDVAAWILLALAIALAGNGPGGKAGNNPLISIWILISGLAFIGFMLIFVRPMMNWVARQCSRQQELFEEGFICLTLVGVLLSGFMTDLIGLHAIFGAFVFGLTIPKGGEFAARLIKSIEYSVAGLLLPLYFASSGLKTDVAKIRSVEAWGILALLISTACVGKILGTFVVAMLFMIPVRDSLALGVLMNTKGLVELIVLNIGREKKVLNDEMFAILVLMAIFTTFMTTPIVISIHKHSRRTTTLRRIERKLPQAENPKAELRILACIHGPGNAPSFIDLIESTRSDQNFPLKLYAMHLVELTDRSSCIMMVQRTRKNGTPFFNCLSRGTSNNEITAAFEAYSRVGQVTICHSTAISALPTMHEDICHVAEDMRAAMIILPFHKQWGVGVKDIENVGYGWGDVNQRVLKMAPCSVAVFVDRGFGGTDQAAVFVGQGLGGSDQEEAATATMLKRVCILVFDGPDDHQVLELGGRMAENPAVGVTVMRFKETAGLESKNQSDDKENEEVMEEFKRKWNGSIEYIEKEVSNVVTEVLNIGKSNAFELLIVGKRTMEGKKEDNQAEHPELGFLGNILASSNHGIVSSVLVIQHHVVRNEGMVTDARTIEDEASV